ncbi:MAG: hypothetical protein E6X17_15935 [Sporomusaceae bacterium]|nr:hypothetical protein [Sporomusaceae bacterium]
MQANTGVHCPVCGSRQLLLKYEVSYEYAYTIDENAPGIANHDRFLPYLYDQRKQTASRQSISCPDCGASFPCHLDHRQGIDAAALQQAIDAGCGSQT